MKNFLFASLVIGFMGLMAFQEHQAQKKYKVEQSLAWWQKTLGIIDATKTTLKISDIPSKQVTFYIDSLLTPLQMEIINQVQDQLNAEIKKDTTVAKPKKN